MTYVDDQGTLRNRFGEEVTLFGSRRYHDCACTPQSTCMACLTRWPTYRVIR